MNWKPGVIALLVSLTALSCDVLSRRELNFLRWREFSSEQGAFPVVFPGKPEEKKETVNTAVGDIGLTIFIAVLGETMVCFVSYSDYPAEILRVSDTRQLLANSRDGIMRAQNARLLREHQIALGGNPGLEFIAEITVDGHEALLKARSYLVGNRLYQAHAIALDGQEALPDIDRFLKSFRLRQMP